MPQTLRGLQCLRTSTRGERAIEVVGSGGGGVGVGWLGLGMAQQQ
jgi:hypothetical protein